MNELSIFSFVSSCLGGELKSKRITNSFFIGVKSFEMETKAAARFIRISPRKIRLIMDQVRGMQVDKAINKLTFAPQSHAPF